MIIDSTVVKVKFMTFLCIHDLCAPCMCLHDDSAHLIILAASSKLTIHASYIIPHHVATSCAVQAICRYHSCITCTQGPWLRLPNVKALVDDGLQDGFGGPMEEQALMLSAEAKPAAQLLLA